MSKKISDYPSTALPLTGSEMFEVQTVSPASARCTAQDIANLGFPSTVAGDMVIGGVAGKPTRVPISTDGYVWTLVAGSPAWAASGGGGGGGAVQPLVKLNPQAASYTLLLTDFPSDGSITDVQITNAGATTVTIPPSSSVAAPIGSQVLMSAWGAGAVTWVAGAGVTLRAANGVATVGQYDSRYARKVGTDEWQIL